MKTSTRASLFFGLLFLWSAPSAGKEFFVSPQGDDAHAGTDASPFASIQRAQEAANPGDTVFIHGGTYTPHENQIAKMQAIWAYVTTLDKSGTKEKPIRYWAVDGEHPVFDLSQVKPAGKRIDAFYVTGSWLHFKGLEVVGVQVTIKGHTQSTCFANEGSHNIYEQLSMHDGQAIGIYSVRGSDNLFLNCDAYRNRDFTSEDGKGGNVDGFGCHPPKGSTGNIFRGCRAWFNSDDGFDCINAHEPVTFENCWAFYNGFSPAFERLADGNGFKAGGYGSTPVAKLPNPIPRHTVRFCLAVHNKANGFYSNHHLTGSDWINNTASGNGANFNLLCRLADNRTDVDGFAHKLHNNLVYKGAEAVKLDAGKCDVNANSFTLGLKVTEKDFLGTDEKELVLPRQPTGDLPEIHFLHLADGSGLIDKGVDAGFKFHGTHPDLGAFER